MSPYSRGAVLVVLAGGHLSTAGVGIRMMDVASGLQIVVYRAVGMTFFLALYLALKNRGGPLGEFIAMATASASGRAAENAA